MPMPITEDEEVVSLATDYLRGMAKLVDEVRRKDKR
jgi:hypothetical protein